MSEQGKYINHYVDNAVGMLHEYVGQILQLKTQVKVQADLILEKENLIASLRKRESDNQQVSDDRGRLQSKLEEAMNKIGHLTVISNQYAELKKQLIEANSELEGAKKQLEDTKKRARKKTELNTESTETNDF